MLCVSVCCALFVARANVMLMCVACVMCFALRVVCVVACAL